MSRNNASLAAFAQLRISPVVLVRVCSILFVGLMIGHMSAHPWASSVVPREAQLVGLMKTTDFVFAGEHQTYWGLYYGWGVLVGVLLAMTAIILWLVSDLAHLVPRRVGLITGAVSLASLIGTTGSAGGGSGITGRILCGCVHCFACGNRATFKSRKMRLMKPSPKTLNHSSPVFSFVQKLAIWKRRTKKERKLMNIPVLKQAFLSGCES